MSKIQHVVLIIKENHTFDSMFGTLAGVNGFTDAQAALAPTDMNHEHSAWMTRGTKNQFQYKEADLSYYFKMARQFVICDNYFSEFASPSTPNHLALICGDSPCIENPHNHTTPTPAMAYDLPSLPMALEKAGLTWGSYGGYAFGLVKELIGKSGVHSSNTTFLKDLKAGKLPTVSWLYADGKSEHPPQNIKTGQTWTKSIIDGIQKSAYWNNTAVFLTYDDWGGWYDHVTPPSTELWDASKAQKPADAYAKYNGQQFRLGSRVPCLVMSPLAKPGYISKTQHSHVSLVRFCEDVFNLPHLNAHTAAASNMFDCFQAL
jgi:phospholipase C